MGKCIKCGKQRADVYRKGLKCNTCKAKISQNVVAQLRAKEGPYFDKWLAGMQRAIENLPEQKPTTKSKKKAKSRRGKHQLRG